MLNFQRLMSPPLIRAAVILGVLGVGLFIWEQSAQADSADESRYPYDPACAWGRISDGKGMLVRCISQAESQRLAEAKGAPRKEGEAKAEEKPGAAEPEQPPAQEKPDEKSSAPPVQVTLKEIRVDEGTLPNAIKRLSTVKARYEACVQDNGGLQAALGEVSVRFLVRERGRAEGVSVAKRKGVSEAAAKCVADVVDRRLVGQPVVPITGANLDFEFRKRP